MKFSGSIGFQLEEEETSPGIWKPVFEEKPYVGDIFRNTRGWQQSSDKQNPDLTTSNQISILSDLYARQNWQMIRYVVWNGVKWSVTTVDLNYPRINLTLGGVYGENERGSTQYTV